MRYDEIAELNRELLRMVDFTSPLWNGGARYWLEHRGPSLARAIGDAPGLKLWLQAPPIGQMDRVLKVCALLSDHLVVGHFGPLPPHHLGLAFPWRMDESTEIPPPPHTHGRPIEYPLRVDAVRRPLPPLAKQCLLGPIRTALQLGMLSYFPASIVYSPLGDNPWPGPGELMSRDGKLPTGHRLIGVKKEAVEQEPQAPDGRNASLGWTVGDQGYPEFDDPRAFSNMWEWSEMALRWEMLFASLIASGGVEMPEDQAARIARLPDAVLRLRFPYIQNADWEVIYRMKEKEHDALQSFRDAILKACASVSAEAGSKRFDNAVRDIQERVIDKGVRDVRKSFRRKRLRDWAKVAGLGIVVTSLEIACYSGLPPLASLLAHGATLAKSIDMAFDFRKEEEEWKKRAGTEKPMYFLWRLRKAR